MNDKSLPGFVDELVDSALRSSRAEEPRAGLETRILAGVRARQVASRRQRWAWALAVSGGGVAIIALLAFGLRPVPRIQPTPASPPLAGSEAARAAATPQQAPKLLTIPGRHLHTASAAVPRLAQFPSAEPLSEQEKLLLVYVRDTPASALMASATKDMRELQIPDLNIPDLEIKALAGSSDNPNSTGENHEREDL